MNNPLRFALIGCGRIAAKHAEILGSGQVSGASLAGVCDLVLEKAQKLGAKYGVPAFQDMQEMMQTLGDDVDACSILTESGNHAANCLDLVQYGKNIIVEKPMALRVDDADRMIQACDKAGIKLFVIKQNRFNRPVQLLREQIEAGRFGKLFLGTVRVRWSRDQAYYDLAPWRGTWALDGGVFANQASHHIDLLTWMMGDVETVFAKSLLAMVDIETEDTGVVVLKFQNGALGIIEATTATRPSDLEGSISILGENGTVEIGGFAANEIKTFEFVDITDDESKALKDCRESPPNVYGFGHLRYYEHVIDVIHNGGSSLVDGLEGRNSLEVIQAIYESVETGKEVFVRANAGHKRLGRLT